VYAQSGIDDQTLGSAHVGLRPTASAYSIRQRLLTTVWNIGVAAVFVAVAFGRWGGKRLVEESTARAREPQAEPRA
jgi:hypothetical protein